MVRTRGRGLKAIVGRSGVKCTITAYLLDGIIGLNWENVTIVQWLLDLRRIARDFDILVITSLR
jgi:hypothetical protein